MLGLRLLSWKGDVLRAGATILRRRDSSTGVVQVQVEQDPNGMIGEEFLEEYDCWRE